MPFDNKFIKDLLEIIKLIDEKNISNENGALEKFKTHLKEVISIGRFSVADWNVTWRETVYKFGTKFSELDPIDFLNAITEAKKEIEKDQQEVLDFYYSEIDYNSLPQETCTKRMESLVAKYPYNPEFRHTWGHFHKRKGEYLQAIEQYNSAIAKDNGFKSFKDSLFSCYQEYLETLIDKSEYDKGLKISQDLVSKKVFSHSSVLHNYLIGLNERFKDYILLNKKIEAAELSIKDIVAQETQKGQVKIIEILGFFTAIIAFIFSTVSIGKNFSFNEAIIFNITLGITLMTFVLMISIFFSSKEVKTFDFRVLMFLILIISLLMIVIKFGMPIWIK